MIRPLTTGRSRSVSILPPDYRFCPYCATPISDRIEEGRTRQYCKHCDRKFFPVAGNAVAGVAVRNHRVLMAQRNREPYIGTWMFPAGFVEYGEDLLEALPREFKEETGLSISNAKLIDIMQSRDDLRSPGHFVTFYEVDVKGKVVNNDLEENRRIEWFPIMRPPEIGFRTHRSIMVTLQAKMKEMPDLSSCAFFGVDLQNCFGHKKGGLYVKGSEKIIPACNRLIDAAAYWAKLTIFSLDWHPVDSDHFKKWPPHGIADTWDSQFLKSLIVPDYSKIVRKATKKNEDGYDPFEGKSSSGETTNKILKKHGIKSIVFFGIATDYCVKAGVLSALKNGYRAYIVTDASIAVNVNPDDEIKAINEMVDAGAIPITVEEVLAWAE